MLEPTPDRGTVAVVVEPRRRRGAAIIGAAIIGAVALVGSGVAAARTTGADDGRWFAFQTVLLAADTVALGTGGGRITSREITVKNDVVEALKLRISTTSDAHELRFSSTDPTTALEVRVVACDVPFVAGFCPGNAFTAMAWTPFATVAGGGGGAWLTARGEQAELQVSFREPQADVAVPGSVSFSLIGL